jgi:hypothetical protein
MPFERVREFGSRTWVPEQAAQRIGIELPARETTTSHRPGAGESFRVAYPADSGGRQLGALACRAVAGQLQCLVGQLGRI